MATAGVSRSGRVRKKSAKLIEMEIETNPQNISLNNGSNNAPNNRNSIKLTPNVDNNNSVGIGVIADNVSNTDNSIDDNISKSDSDSGKPPKKKLKFKLSLNSSPVVTSDESKTSDKSIKIENQSEECADSLPKKATIPPLKIPKSKITGLVPNITPEVNSNDKDSKPEPNSTTNPINPSVERKAKKVKNQTNIKTEIDSKPEPKESIETKSEVIETPTKAVEQTRVKVSEPLGSTANHRPIEETPKAVKPKKKEQESAANRLFRQITSGVPVSVKTKGKRNKSIPLEDVTQISFDEEFSETSLIIETEEPIKPKPKKRSRPTKTANDNKKDEKKSKRSKSTADDKPKKKRNAVITAYMIWSKEQRSKIQQTFPELDFADVSRKLGEIWQSMPEKERIPWRRKAQKLVGKGSSIISTGKPKASTQASKLNNSSIASGSALSSDLLNSDDYSNYASIDDLWRPVGTTPIDVSSHLTLLGESLSIIGQRLKEHSGQIAVSGSLSVLLDSTLCAIGPLLCLTQLDPNLNGCSQETHKKTLDNIAYIMPGI